MIELREVTKEYSKGVAALNGINLKIEQGEFVFIVGDSGSGKSTLIKLIMKELEPTSGTIIVNGNNLSRMKHRRVPMYRRNIGVVFQDFRLLKDRNIYENIAFAQRVTETSTRIIKKKVPAALSLVGLAQKYKAFPKELSGGVKTLILMAFDDSNKVFNASACGDNCAKWIFRIGERKDLTINLRHIMDFGTEQFEAIILNTGETVHNMAEFVDIAGQYV